MGTFSPPEFRLRSQSEGSEGGTSSPATASPGRAALGGGGPGCSPEQRGQEGAGAVPRPSMARTKSPPYARLRSFSSRSKLLALTISSTSEMSSSYLLLPRARCKTQSGRRALRTGVGDTHTRYPSPPAPSPSFGALSTFSIPGTGAGSGGAAAGGAGVVVPHVGKGRPRGGFGGGRPGAQRSGWGISIIPGFP